MVVRYRAVFLWSSGETLLGIEGHSPRKSVAFGTIKFRIRVLWQSADVRNLYQCTAHFEDLPWPVAILAREAVCLHCLRYLPGRARRQRILVACV